MACLTSASPAPVDVCSLLAAGWPIHRIRDFLDHLENVPLPVPPVEKRATDRRQLVPHARAVRAGRENAPVAGER
jgi:hypothetical protein